MNTLRTVQATRDAGGSRTVHGYLDFEVDGERLAPGIQRAGYDLISCLWTDPVARSASVDAAERLLGSSAPDAPGERISVYVCGECGDLSCGALTVRLEVADDVVRWRAWGYQNNYEDEVQETNGLAWLGDLTFARGDYESTIRAAMSRLRT